MRIRLWLSIAGLAGATALAAQEPPPRAPAPRHDGPRSVRHREPGGPFMIYSPDRLVNRREYLDLSADQVSRLETLAQAERQARDQADSTARHHEDQLPALWDAAQPDVRAIETHIRAAGDARQAGLLAAARSAAQGKAVLNPEQQGRVAGWLDGARSMMRRGDGPRRSQRPGRPTGGRRPGSGFRRGA